MLTGHAPAGYLLARVFQHRHRAGRSLLLTISLLGSLGPDLDLAYFYTLGGRAVHHHSYLTHTPIFWIALSLAFAVVGGFRRVFLYAVAFLLATLLHLSLDSIAGQIRWLWPLSNAGLTLVNVPARHHCWLLNFVLHWTFGLELAVWAAAYATWRYGGPHAA